MKTKNLISSMVTALVAVAGMSATAVAGTIRHDRSDSQYRNFANNFASVGMLETGFSIGGQSVYGLCSGTLISANWVLTAAHCFEDPLGRGNLLNRGSFTVGGRSYSINAGAFNGGWLSSGRNPETGVDIGLFRLSSSVLNINPATLYSGSNEDMQLGNYAGFGNTGTGTSGVINGTYGTKRAGQNIIGLGSRAGYSNQVLISDFDDPQTANSWDSLTQSLNLEYQLAGGDSGGGLFIGGLLAGVNSFIFSRDGRTDADYGDYSATTRVSSQVNWITNVIRGMSTSGILSSLPRSSSTFRGTLSDIEIAESELIGDLSQPLTVYEDIWDNSETVPEPTTILGGLLSLSGLIAACRRRQQASN